MYVSNDLMKTNVGYNKLQLNAQKKNSDNHITPETKDIPAPCDAKYLLKRNNINFCAKYKIKKLKLDEFANK